MSSSIASAVQSSPARGERSLLRRFERVRAFTEELCAPLAVEDHVVQTMPDVSPTKWHLAHTTWFFETFLLRPYRESYRPFDPLYESLFNSYYNSVGEQRPRPGRGLLSRPTVAEVLAYRAHVDEEMRPLLEGELPAEVASVVEIGLQHEQQHQELILTDAKHVLSRNPGDPVYQERPPEGAATRAAPMAWIRYPEAIREVGHAGEGFAFDNESPRHRVLVGAFEIASRPVTAGEYLQFIEDGGYRSHRLWLSEGWARVRTEGWEAPLYWQRDDDGWSHFTLAGRRPIDPAEPVVHLCHFEADAFARWAGARLPTEAEWETAAEGHAVAGRFADSRRFHPGPAVFGGEGLQQLFGDVWEWTQSAYGPYPGYAPAEGALGEYNGKFMSGQMVLRGGSIATPPGHVRPTYRNFWHPWVRTQFSGLRLARLP